ncbi:MAG TPA: hypothetical protein VF292_14810 [Rhodanobacteraceae bacterium]
MPGPVPGNPAAIRGFTELTQWRRFVLDLQLSGRPPDAILQAHERVLRVLYLAWFDGAVIKFAELGALACLEAAISSRYPQKFRGLEQALKYLIPQSGVTDANLRVVRECGGAAIANLVRHSNGGGPALSEIRNQIAHGDPFATLPYGGLFEVVRDLTDFMYPATRPGQQRPHA